MQNLTKFVCLTTIVLSFNSIAVHAEEVKSKAGDDNIYAFANYGASQNIMQVSALPLRVAHCPFQQRQMMKAPL